MLKTKNKTMAKLILNFFNEIGESLKSVVGLIVFFAGFIFIILFVVSLFTLITTGRLPKPTDFPAVENDNANCEQPAYMGGNCP